MPEGPSKRARIQLGLIALLFFGPLIVAAFLYYGGYFQGMQARSNHGQLLNPVISLTESRSFQGCRNPLKTPPK